MTVRIASLAVAGLLAFHLLILLPKISTTSMHRIGKTSSSSSASKAASATMAAALSTTATSSSAGGPPQPQRGALIFLHGLGDTPLGWSSLEQTIPSLLPSLANSKRRSIEYVFPPAPTIPITINGGVTMPGWFDLYDWPIDVGSKDDPDGLWRGVAQVEQEVMKLEVEKGIPSSNIVLGGFSQGGAVALLAAYRSPQRKQYAGCIGLSAWLTLPDELERPPLSDEAKSIPLFWGHGKYDDKVLFPQQDFGVRTLSSAGVRDITAKDYPVGHSSHPDEMEDMAEFLDRVLTISSCSEEEGASAETPSSTTK